ncbi:MAG: iron-containing alcohol dehydrogenase family protein [Elainellaceae cyanobacterium]
MSASPTASLSYMALSPSRVIRGQEALTQSAETIAQLGDRPLLIGGDRTLKVAMPYFNPLWNHGLKQAQVAYGMDCSENSLESLRAAVAHHKADFIIGVGGGKALDAAKLVAAQHHLPIVTVPTSAATCAAWTALSNVYSDEGAFLYDVSLPRCPDLLVLDYGLVQTAPRRTLIAGIGDALAKWYEASVSSGHSSQTLIISAVQQARVLRDILFQKSLEAVEHPGSEAWREVVDASVLMAGVIGGMGGAQCRTVAAHAVHNGLTHLLESHDTLHGEKVAYGILVQLRLEELMQGNQLAATARQQLLKFYHDVGLPRTLQELGLGGVSIDDLQQAAEVACIPESDIHHLPFEVMPVHLMAAMVSTTAPAARTAEAAPRTSLTLSTPSDEGA